MDVGLFIPLMIAAVQSAGNVLSSFVSKAKDVANKHIFDKEFLEKAITDSTHQLSELLMVASANVKQEIIEQGIIDVVQDLQAHIISMGKLINSVQTSEISTEVADKLIASGIFPLSVSLQRVELRLKYYGRDDMLSHCHIVGTNALLSGYRYLGQSAPSYQKDLEDSVLKFQKHLLDSIAYMTIHAKKEFPWEQVPHLITIEGISDLVEFYNSILETSDKDVYPQRQPIPQIDVPLYSIEIHGNEIDEWKAKFGKIGWLEELGQNTKEAISNSPIEHEIAKKPLLCVTYADGKGSHITKVLFNDVDLSSKFTCLIITPAKIVIIVPSKSIVKTVEYKNIKQVEIIPKSQYLYVNTYVISTTIGDSLKINTGFIYPEDNQIVDSFFKRITPVK